MKKFFAIATIAASLAACSGGSEKTTEETKVSDTTTIAAPVKDSLKIIKDSVTKTTVTVDTVKKAK